MLFKTSGGYFKETSIKEMMDIAGVPANKIILGKPSIVADALNTGYVESNFNHLNIISKLAININEMLNIILIKYIY